MRKWLGRIVCAVCALFLLWCVVSFIEVNCKNMSENPTYWKYNMFVVLFDTKGDYSPFVFCPCKVRRIAILKLDASRLTAL